MIKFIVLFLMLGSLWAQPLNKSYKIGKKIRYYAKVGFSRSFYIGDWNGKTNVNINPDTSVVTSNGALIEGVVTLPKLKSENVLHMSIGSMVNAHDVSLSIYTLDSESKVNFLAFDFEYGYWWNFNSAYRFYTGGGFDFALLNFKDGFVYKNGSKSKVGMTQKGLHAKLGFGYFLKYLGFKISSTIRSYNTANVNIPENNSPIELNSDLSLQVFESKAEVMLLW
jgi:hypothetical protein